MDNSNTYDYVKMDESKQIPDTVKLNNSGVDKCLKGDFEGGICDFIKSLENSNNDSIVSLNLHYAHYDLSIIFLLSAAGLTYESLNMPGFYTAFDTLKKSLELGLAKNIN